MPPSARPMPLLQVFYLYTYWFTILALTKTMTTTTTGVADQVIVARHVSMRVCAFSVVEASLLTDRGADAADARRPTQQVASLISELLQ